MNFNINQSESTVYCQHFCEQCKIKLICTRWALCICLWKQGLWFVFSCGHTPLCGVWGRKKRPSFTLERCG